LAGHLKHVCLVSAEYFGQLAHEDIRPERVIRLDQIAKYASKQIFAISGSGISVLDSIVKELEIFQRPLEKFVEFLRGHSFGRRIGILTGRESHHPNLYPFGH
jgi:hypothetical protein